MLRHHLLRLIQTLNPSDASFWTRFHRVQNLRSFLLTPRSHHAAPLQRPLPLHGQLRRSILAEALLNHKAHGLLTAYSAGSHPSGTPRPEALVQLASAGISTEGLRSKSWDEFAAPTAPQMNFVFTVCDNAANEVCPYWPGQPLTAHWGIPDPAAVQGTPEQIARAFRDAFTILDRRISLFLALPLTTLSQLAIHKEITQIGRA